MYAGQRYYVKAADVSLNDAAGASGYTGVTLRRANLYAAPDASQDPVDFFWGGVLLSGYSRVDAAGQWLTIMYAGQRYYAVSYTHLDVYKRQSIPDLTPEAVASADLVMVTACLLYTSRCV